MKLAKLIKLVRKELKLGRLKWTKEELRSFINAGLKEMWRQDHERSLRPKRSKDHPI